MGILHLYIMDISLSVSTSGVDRYVEKLLKGLKGVPSIQVHWIQFLHDENLLLYREEQYEHYAKITFPLPQNYMEIIVNKFWMKKYNEHIFHLIAKLFSKEEHRILHLHTLNLIDLALLIKQHVNCSIITHLHCIPWKNFYNSDLRRFNTLYSIANVSPCTAINQFLFLTNSSELASYTDSDHIICVTQCQVDFLTNIMGISQDKISLIHNGIDDFADNYRRTFIKSSHSQIQCLFVANISRGKGLEFVLQALRILRKEGYNIILKIAGHSTPVINQVLKDEYSDLHIDILGMQTFEQLIELYMSSDIGVIASLQEQWSLVAVEMAMFGLPVVTTAVDGLDEIFTDNDNALKTPLQFSPIFGLSVDIEVMANKIKLLIEDTKLRKKLSDRARILYKEKLSLHLMIEQTVEIYKQLNRNTNDTYICSHASI